jgi:hypothetical protein
MTRLIFSRRQILAQPLVHDRGAGTTEAAVRARDCSARNMCDELADVRLLGKLILWIPISIVPARYCSCTRLIITGHQILAQPLVRARGCSVWFVFPPACPLQVGSQA